MSNQPSLFSVEPLDADAIVNSDRINIRKAPGVDSSNPAIAQVSKGTPLKVTGKTTIAGPYPNWYRILYNDAEAFVDSDFVTLELPPAPTVILTVPWFSEVDDLYDKGLYDGCGPSTVLMLLKAYQVAHVDSVSQMTQYHIAPGTLLNLNRLTSQDQLAALALDAGPLTLKLDQTSQPGILNTVRTYLTQRKPMIMFLNYANISGSPFRGNPYWSKKARDNHAEWHWLAVIGMDGNQFIVNDPLWSNVDNKGAGGKSLAIASTDLSAAYGGMLLVPADGMPE